MDEVIKTLEECREMLKVPGPEEAEIARKTIAACIMRLEELQSENRPPDVP